MKTPDFTAPTSTSTQRRVPSVWPSADTSSRPRPHKYRQRFSRHDFQRATREAASPTTWLKVTVPPHSAAATPPHEHLDLGHPSRNLPVDALSRSCKVDNHLGAPGTLVNVFAACPCHGLEPGVASTREAPDSVGARRVRATRGWLQALIHVNTQPR
eukprot:3496116-Rhodomonas_salina.2